jgi:hypothetical protein
MLVIAMEETLVTIGEEILVFCALGYLVGS